MGRDGHRGVIKAFDEAAQESEKGMEREVGRVDTMRTETRDTGDKPTEKGPEIDEEESKAKQEKA